MRINLKKANIKIEISDLKNHLILLYKFSFPAMASGLVQWGAIWIGSVILANQNSGYSEVGLYNAGYQWFAALIFLPSIVSNAFFPVLSERSGALDYVSFKKIFYIAILNAIVFITVASLMIIVARNLISSAYGPEFKNLDGLIVVFAITALFASVHNLMSNTLAIVNKMWVNFSANFVWGLFFVIFGYVFCASGQGAFGLAYGAMLAYFVRFVIMTFFSYRYINQLVFLKLGNN